VVVSGGVSHMPFVRDGLSRFFGRQLTPLVNPDEAICLGAGLRAAQLAKHPVLGVGRF
jgi:molecular chaperone DnaK